jgi:rod shape-determining protein MreC
MFKRPHYIALGLVVLLTLIVLNLPNHTASQLKLAIGSFFLPLFGLSKSVHQLRERGSDALVPRPTLLKENDQLRLTNQELLIRAMQGDATARENEQLRQLLGWQKQSSWKLKLANVIARDPGNWWHVIQIDAGSRDGISQDMPVVIATGTNAALVGRISAVGLASSQVSLIGNSDCKVAALVPATGDMGVVTGIASPLDNTLVTLSYLASNSNLKPGQMVFTSGEGKIFQKGIVIGQVAEDSHQAELGYTEARVKLAADLGKLEEVWVLIK